MPSVTICSIYPIRLTAERNGFQPTPVFGIAAAPRGKFSRLTVEDSYEFVYQGQGLPRLRQDWSALELATSLVLDWKKAAHSSLIESPNAQIGVWVHEGAEKLDDKAILSSNLYRAALASQEAYANHYCSIADTLYHDPNRRGEITEKHRKLASWLGITDKDRHPWISFTTTADAISCPMCGKRCTAGVALCSGCSHVLDQGLYRELAASNDAFLASLAKGKVQPAAATK